MGCAPGVLKLVTKLATIRERTAFKALQRIYGFNCKIFFPNNGEYDPVDRTGSIYNWEDQDYRFDIENPSIECANLGYLGLF